MTDMLMRAPAVDVDRQPYRYRRVELVEPDWRRLPGWRDVTAEQWRSAQWQRAHCVKNVAQLRAVMGEVGVTFFCLSDEAPSSCWFFPSDERGGALCSFPSPSLPSKRWRMAT